MTLSEVHISVHEKTHASTENVNILWKSDVTMNMAFAFIVQMSYTQGEKNKNKLSVHFRVFYAVPHKNVRKFQTHCPE